jgi:tetratricopeptide (TPR) repeat protein
MSAARLKQAIADHQAGRLDEAAAAFERAIVLAPDDADAFYSLGMVEIDRKHFEAALTQLTRCLQRAPHHAQVRNGLALALLRLGRIDGALSILAEQLAMRPNDFEALNNLCVARTMQGEYVVAREVADKAVSLRSGRVDIRLNRSHLMLLKGDFKNGFAEHEWRLRRRDYRQKFHVPRWNGEHLPDGAIQIWAEQGLGDALHFIRYMPMVRERVGRVLLKCREPLRRLFATIPGVDQIIMPRTATSYDVHAPLMSMPYIFNTEPH